MSDDIDGIYAGYFAGKDGEGLALLLLRRGVLVGSDAMGNAFDGTFVKDAGSGSHSGKVKVTAQPNTILVQGVSTGPNGLTYEADFQLPPDFLSAPFLRIDTPLGPVNLVLRKLRSLGD